MRKARVLFKAEEAGSLLQHDNGSFTFTYHDVWLTDSSKPGISLTLPKTKPEYHSEYLFPFFYNMLPEGSNKQVVCRLMKIDSDDYFGMLLNTAQNDTIGAVRVIKVEQEL